MGVRASTLRKRNDGCQLETVLQLCADGPDGIVRLSSTCAVRDSFAAQIQGPGGHPREYRRGHMRASSVCVRGPGHYSSENGEATERQDRFREAQSDPCSGVTWSANLCNLSLTNAVFTIPAVSLPEVGAQVTWRRATHGEGQRRAATGASASRPWCMRRGLKDSESASFDAGSGSATLLAHGRVGESCHMCLLPTPRPSWAGTWTQSHAGADAFIRDEAGGGRRVHACGGMPALQCLLCRGTAPACDGHVGSSSGGRACCSRAGQRAFWTEQLARRKQSVKER